MLSKYYISIWSVVGCIFGLLLTGMMSSGSGIYIGFPGKITAILTGTLQSGGWEAGGRWIAAVANGIFYGGIGFVIAWYIVHYRDKNNLTKSSIPQCSVCGFLYP